MCRETLTDTQFLEQIDQGRTDFLSCFFPNRITLSSDSKISAYRPGGKKSVRLPTKLRMETCEFAGEVELYGMVLESASFDGSIFQEKFAFGNNQVAYLGGECSIFHKWAGFINATQTIPWGMWRGAKFNEGFLMQKFPIGSCNLDGVESPMSLFNEADIGSLSAIGANLGKREWARMAV